MIGKKLMLGVFAIALVAVIALITPVPVSSETYNETSTYCNVTVSVVIDASVSNVPVDFGTLNPGVSDQTRAGNQPVNVTVHANTNTIWKLAVKSSGDFTGAGTLAIANLDYGNVSGTIAIDMTTTYASPFSDWTNQADPSADTIRSMYLDITIPSGQTAGTYSTTLYLNVTQAQ